MPNDQIFDGGIMKQRGVTQCGRSVYDAINPFLTLKSDFDCTIGSVSTFPVDALLCCFPFKTAFLSAHENTCMTGLSLSFADRDLSQDNVAHLSFSTTLAINPRPMSEGYHKGTCNAFPAVKCKRVDHT